MFWIPWRRKDDERLAAAREWQAQERAAARGRLHELAATTPEWRRDRRTR